MTSALLVFTSHPSNSGGGSRKHGSRSASNDSLLDAADDPHASHLPNKDFRKSDLNRANYYDHESDVFDREPSPEVRRPRGHRRNDSYGKDPQVGQVTACSLFSLCLSLCLSLSLEAVGRRPVVMPVMLVTHPFTCFPVQRAFVALKLKIFVYFCYAVQTSKYQ